MGKKGGKKGGGKKGGGKKGGAKPLTLATGGNLQTPSSFLLWKQAPPVTPIVHVRTAPQLLPTRPPVTCLTLAVVRGASLGDLPVVMSWITAGEPTPPGSIARVDMRWDSPTSATVQQFTLLMLSAAAGHAHVVEALLKHGADPDLVNGLGHTALIIAASGGQAEVVKHLLQAGCNTDVQAKLGREVNAKMGTALDFALQRGQSFAVALLRTYEALRAGSQQRVLDADVAKACMEGDEQQVLVWLECGGHIDAIHARPEGDYTLLLLACEAGHSSIVAKLLELGADVTLTRSSDKATPMLLAAYGGHRDVVRILLKPKRPQFRPPPGSIRPPRHRAPPSSGLMIKSSSKIELGSREQPAAPVSPTKSEPY